MGTKHNHFKILHSRFTDNEKSNKAQPLGLEIDSENKQMGLIREKFAEWKDSKNKSQNVRWFVESRDMHAAKYPFELLLKEAQKRREDEFSIPFAAEFILKEPWRETFNVGLLDKWWQRYFGNEWIPWKKVDRKAKFPKAYEELAVYLARYEK